MSQIARDIGMTRESIYKALSDNGNPTFATIMRITRALGMRYVVALRMLRRGQADVRRSTMRAATRSPRSVRR